MAFPIGLNVYEQSIPFFWWKPFATNLALYLSIVPSELSFILNTHLHPIIFCWGVDCTKVQVPALRRALYFAVMACLHCGNLNAWVALLGWKGDESNQTLALRQYLGLGFLIPTLDWVRIVEEPTGNMTNVEEEK